MSSAGSGSCSTAFSARSNGASTGYAASALNRGDFLAEGMEMIAKPFDLEQLGRKIREMLGDVH